MEAASNCEGLKREGPTPSCASLTDDEVAELDAARLPAHAA
jgi:hypothetical protein